MVDANMVHVIDDDVAVRQSLAFLLATSGFMVRVYESANAFLGSLDAETTGCVISDIRMPEIDGLELLRRLKPRTRLLPVIVITGHADVPLAVQAMKEGAVDFIEKPFDDERLLNAVRHTLTRGAAPLPAVETDIAGLTRRERQVLDGLMTGKQNKMIALDLALSPRTVEVYRANIMAKLQVGSLPELVRKVLAGGGR